MTCNIINWPHQLTQHFPALFTSQTGYRADVWSERSFPGGGFFFFFGFAAAAYRRTREAEILSEEEPQLSDQVDIQSRAGRFSGALVPSETSTSVSKTSRLQTGTHTCARTHAGLMQAA